MHAYIHIHKIYYKRYFHGLKTSLHYFYWVNYELVSLSSALWLVNNVTIKQELDSNVYKHCYLPQPPLSRDLLTAVTHCMVAVNWWGSIRVSNAVKVLKLTIKVHEPTTHTQELCFHIHKLCLSALQWWYKIDHTKIIGWIMCTYWPLIINLKWSTRRAGVI